MIDAGLVNLAELGVLVIGVVIALQQLRDIKQTRVTELETRQAQLFSVLLDRMDNAEFWTHYLTIRDGGSLTVDEWNEQIAEDPSVYGGIMSIVMFFTHVGYLVKKGLIDIEVVAETMSTAVIRTYENTAQGILEDSKRRNVAPQRLSNIRYLYERLKEVKPESFN